MPGWVRPFLSGVVCAVLIAGTALLATRPRGEAIEIIYVTPAPTTIAAAISGEVARPGVYQLAPGSRVDDLIAAAGGTTEAADPERPSRALLLRDEMQVHIPRRAPTATTAPVAAAAQSALPTSSPAVPASPATTAVAATATAPPAAASVTPVPAAPAVATPAMNAPTATTAPAPPAPPAEPAETGPININTATAAELERLPGIGPALAGRIVEDRERNGPFGSVDELERVKGIGPATVARLRAQARV